jgi:hypothetical protein
MVSFPVKGHAPSPAQYWCDGGFFVQLWCVLFRYSTANDLWHNTLLDIGNGTFHANQVPADFPVIKK